MPVSALFTSNSVELNIPVVAMRAQREFKIEQQQMSFWCWSAASCAVYAWYHSDQAWTQKKLAAAVLNMPVCNTNAPLPLLLPCNQKADMADSLRQINCLAGDPGEVLSKEQLIQELDRQQPVCCQIWLEDIGGHIVVIHSYQLQDNGELFLLIADPADGCDRRMEYSQFKTNYRRAGGRWIRTYLTRS
ncbi:papain-like cysteine protease family protein [Chitinophaga solisilvae]|uniref:papain-like cysteine protease family protein n=1 Tax=Chitinophaga solisilvae TaxID=1233460 RepID=UPI001368018E|nr:papain-like cysteine protease family protein [Chitinophaga solisilvae]